MRSTEELRREIAKARSELARANAETRRHRANLAKIEQSANARRQVAINALVHPSIRGRESVQVGLVRAAVADLQEQQSPKEKPRKLPAILGINAAAKELRIRRDLIVRLIATGKIRAIHASKTNSGDHEIYTDELLYALGRTSKKPSNEPHPWHDNPMPWLTPV